MNFLSLHDRDNLQYFSVTLDRKSKSHSAVFGSFVMTKADKYTLVVKLGTLSLVDESTREPRLANISLIVETLVKLRRLGHRIVLVLLGAIAFGMRRMGLDVKPPVLSKVQALASIGQGLLMSLFDYLFSRLQQTIAQILITRNDILDYTQYKNATNTINELLDMGVIPIVNENDTLSVAEIKFGDNDSLSAITAGMIHADYLFLMTDVECLYTDNPRTNKDAKPVVVVDRDHGIDVRTDMGLNVGTGGMTTKLIAAELATNAGVTTIVTLSSRPELILEIVAQIQSQGPDSLPIDEYRRAVEQAIASGTVPLHTQFLRLPEHAKIRSDRRFWILHGLTTRGALVVDQGCYRALTRRNRAGLLPAGIRDVEGSFHESECVAIKVLPETNDGTPPREVGHCRVNYSSSDVRKIMGVNSHDIEGILGFADSEYVVHRDNIAFPPSIESTTL